VRSPMNYQSTKFGSRQPALKSPENLLIPCGAPPCALSDVMR
jgi:hypothetical protein